MTLHFLADTNVLAEALRPRPRPETLAQIRRHQDQIAIASVIWHEMWFGCHRLPQFARRDAIADYLNQVVAPSFPILSYDQQASEWHAHERARLTALGQTPSFADGMIAAIAITNGLTLITFNLDDFRTFQGLQIVWW